MSGARDPELTGIDVAVMPALAATVSDVLAADGFVLGTPANIGYMSGALKHFFDQIYYPCLQAKIGAPYGLYVHGASDTTGAVRAVAAIAKGLGWAEVVSPVVSTGPVGQGHRAPVLRPRRHRRRQSPSRRRLQAATVRLRPGPCRPRPRRRARRP